jgi:hypothetical protein
MNPLKYWNIEGFEISTFKFKLDERKNKIYKTSGSDETGSCTYTYNELGFRGDSIKKEGFRVMSLGCSNTEGVGVNDHETWPSQFTSLIPNGVNMNFGTGGRGNDFITRCLLTYYDVVKPNLVLVKYTSPLRREIYTEDGGIEPFMPTNSWGYLKETDEGSKTQEYLTYLQNENEDTINWYKNHLLIKYFLESKGCNWLWNGREILLETLDYNEFNRFDVDYGKYLDFGSDKIHPGPKHHEEYAHRLHDFISRNFPEYINGYSKVKKNLI